MAQALGWAFLFFFAIFPPLRSLAYSLAQSRALQPCACHCLCIFCLFSLLLSICNKKNTAYNNAHLMSVFIFVTGIYSTHIIFCIHIIFMQFNRQNCYRRRLKDMWLKFFSILFFCVFLLEIFYIFVTKEKKLKLNSFEKFHQKKRNSV